MNCSDVIMLLFGIFIGFWIGIILYKLSEERKVEELNSKDNGQQCSNCHGTGIVKVRDSICPVCHGMGKVSEK